MPFDGFEPPHRFGGGGGREEPPRKPAIPKAVSQRIAGAEKNLEQLAYAMLDAQVMKGKAGELHRDEIAGHCRDTMVNMFHAMTDPRYILVGDADLYCVGVGVADEYIQAAVRQINHKVDMSRNVPGIRPKDCTGKIPAPWVAPTPEECAKTGWERG